MTAIHLQFHVAHSAERALRRAAESAKRASDREELLLASEALLHLYCGHGPIELAQNPKPPIPPKSEHQPG